MGIKELFYNYAEEFIKEDFDKNYTMAITLENFTKAIGEIISLPVEPPVSKPVYIVYEACFQGDNLLTAFEDREDAEKYIKRAKKNYYISKPIHVVKAC